jgi:hypothetical protein
MTFQHSSLEDGFLGANFVVMSACNRALGTVHNLAVYVTIQTTEGDGVKGLTRIGKQGRKVCNLDVRNRKINVFKNGRISLGQVSPDIVRIVIHIDIYGWSLFTSLPISGSICCMSISWWEN